MLCKCRAILMTTGVKLRLKSTTSHTGCEAWRWEKKKDADLEERRTNEKMLTRLRNKKPRQGVAGESKVFEILFPLEITPLNHDVAWRHGANESGVITCNQSQDYMGSADSVVRSFFPRLSCIHAHQLAHVFTWWPLSTEGDRRRRINCAKKVTTKNASNLSRKSE